MGAIADIVVILGMLSFDVNAEVITECQSFARILHVGQHDFSTYRLSSNIGIPYEIKCAAYCKMEDCLSFSYDEETKTCDTYSRAIGEEDNAGVSTLPVYYSKATELNSCGKLPIGSPSGIYNITLKSGDVLTLYCDVDTPGGPWIVIQRRTLGDVDFYRNWSDYQNGFGDINGDFWIGNDVLHRLTDTPRTLRVDVQSWDGTSSHAQYSTFIVGNESTNYKLTVHEFSGNVSFDAMSYHNGQPFTTFDRDNDSKDNANCAHIRTGAWWYGNCCKSNLNGRFQEDNGDSVLSMFWRDFPSGRVRAPLNMSKMMIR